MTNEQERWVATVASTTSRPRLSKGGTDVATKKLCKMFASFRLNVYLCRAQSFVATFYTDDPLGLSA